MNAVPHKNTSPALFRAVLLFFVASLLSAQLGAAEHRATHAFHKHTELCRAFIDFDHNGANPLSGAAPLLASLGAIVVAFLFSPSATVIATRDFTRIRGPPLLLA